MQPFTTIRGEFSINRTKVELKCAKLKLVNAWNLTINRTKVELKL